MLNPELPQILISSVTGPPESLALGLILQKGCPLIFLNVVFHINANSKTDILELKTYEIK